MGIVASASKGIQEALSRLRSDQPAEHEGAIARLTLVGRRSARPLASALPGLPPAARLAALDLLERIGDAAVLPAILDCLDDPAPGIADRAATAAVALGGSSVTGALAQRLRGSTPRSALAASRALGTLAAEGHVPSLDALLAATVDEQQDDAIRLSALAAAARGAGSEIRRILVRLTESPSPRIAAEARARLASGRPASASSRSREDRGSPRTSRATTLVAAVTAASRRVDTRRRWLQAVDAEGPAILDALHAALSSRKTPEVTVLLAEATGRLARPASIPVLRDLLVRLDHSPDGLLCAAAVHTALAALDSRVALADLRERLDRASGPTAAELVRSAGLVGDATFGSCLASLAGREADLEPIAAAAYRSIARRHRITTRSRSVTSLASALRVRLERWLRS